MGTKIILVFLSATLSQSLVLAQSTHTTEYRQEFEFACPENEFLTSLKSTHRNSEEDRQWEFECLRPAPNAETSNCSWTDDFINDLDGPMFFSCPNDHAFAGMAGTYDTDAEDRRFKIRCCRRPNKILISCGLSDFQNEMDGPLDFEAPGNTVIIGMYSYHNNRAGDRVFRFMTCGWCGSRRCKT